MSGPSIDGCSGMAGWSWTQFQDWLRELPAPVDLNRLTVALKNLRLEPGDIEPFVRFSPETYQRNTVLKTEHVQVIVICWKRDQASPIHDHRGSACGVRVVSGTAAETLFDVTDQALPKPTLTVHHHPDDVTVSFDRDAHRIMPVDNDLISLHVYSPPLTQMTIYPEAIPLRSPRANGVEIGGDPMPAGVEARPAS